MYLQRLRMLGRGWMWWRLFNKTAIWPGRMGTVWGSFFRLCCRQGCFDTPHTGQHSDDKALLCHFYIQSLVLQKWTCYGVKFESWSNPQQKRWSVHHLNCFLAVTLYIHMDVFNQKLILLYPKLTRLFEVTTYFFCLYVDNIFCLRVLLPQWGSWWVF